MLNTFSSLLFGFSVALLVAILAGVLVLAFEIIMFIDAIQNVKLSNDRRLLWLLGMFFIHPFVAIVYYFTDYSKRDTSA